MKIEHRVQDWILLRSKVPLVHLGGGSGGGGGGGGRGIAVTTVLT